MRRRILIAVIVVVAAALLARFVIVVRDLPAIVTSARFEDVRADHTLLRDFLQAMPKGGDLHVHLSGAVYAERFIAWAVRDKLCLRRSDMSILDRPDGASDERPCGPDPTIVPIAEAVSGPLGQTTYDLLIDALSMRSFLRSQTTPSGHDQFFGTFGKFNAATGGANWEGTSRRIAEMTVDQLRQYDADSVQYTELMVTFFEGEERLPLSRTIVNQTDPAAMLAMLKQNHLDDVVAAKVQQLMELVAQIEALRDCGNERTKLGCGVTFRFIAQINRNSTPADVFTHTALAAALIRAAPQIVAGLNYVGPEDYRVSLRDYRTQMQWVGFLARDVPVALHAGELWIGLVPPEYLTFHIRDAVETAGARRIGHGTALPFERDTVGLLAEMRRRGVTVEIALTSSDLILGVRGDDHPLPTYLAAGVSVVLATDDAGVSRINLSNEYFRAARDFPFGYRGLKAIARNALTRSFLAADEKQREFDRFDRLTADFERAVADRQPPLGKLAVLIRALLLPAP